MDIKNSHITKKMIHGWRKTIYQEYLDLLSEKDREAKPVRRGIIRSVFHSGKIIHSGLTAEFMRDIYYYFLSI